MKDEMHNARQEQLILYASSNLFTQNPNQNLMPKCQVRLVQSVLNTCISFKLISKYH